LSTIEHLASALATVCPERSGTGLNMHGLAREAQRQLRRWGHEGYELTLERVDRGPGSGPLRCWFWCESCHVSQLLVLDEPEVR